MEVNKMGITLINDVEEEKKYDITICFSCTSKGNYLIDTEITPAFCTKCNTQVSGFFAYQGSRYGQVGEIQCDHCKSKILCTDDDYARYRIFMSSDQYFNRFIYTEGQFDSSYSKVLIDFEKTYNLTKETFLYVKEKTGYDIFHSSQDIKLSQLITILSQKIGLKEENIPNIEITLDPRFPHMPSLISKWFNLLNIMGKYNKIE